MYGVDDVMDVLSDAISNPDTKNYMPVFLPFKEWAYEREVALTTDDTSAVRESFYTQDGRQFEIVVKEV